MKLWQFASAAGLPSRTSRRETLGVIGTQIGDLRLVRPLGNGGMGSVYLVEHLLINELRPIEMLDPRLSVCSHR